MIGQYRFNRVNKYGSRTRWVCVKAKAGCRASLHTMDNAILKIDRSSKDFPIQIIVASFLHAEAVLHVFKFLLLPSDLRV
ncbi:unnamed protein product [Euphydryas editha]|uniref:FLYWCH-type domain-containing protein n=1 Tax=Euphydryas editha TaxID=104508 RepID=A0AAU9THU6_EUPED|nr:unnamed protein product [Euphydryas editha]